MSDWLGVPLCKASVKQNGAVTGQHVQAHPQARFLGTVVGQGAEAT